MLAGELGEKLAETLVRRHLPLPDYIVPVPLHPLRLMGRGFNQAEEIARVLSGKLGAPLKTRALKRTRNTVPQFDLSFEQRAINVKDAFLCRSSFEGLRVAIVDDIVTTGHTTQEIARRLRLAGAAEIYLWACARAA